AAAGSLATAARLAPDDAELRLLLATALYRAGETAAAAGELEAASRLAPGDPRVAALLEKVRREAAAEQGHDRAASEHFTVSFEGGGTSAQAGYLVGLLLEEAYHAVGDGLGYRPVRRIHAVLYPAQQFRDVTRSPAWAGALYDGKIRIPVGGLTDKSELLARVVRHEYAHALVHELSGGRAPVWLNEGVAMLSEGPVDRQLLDAFRAYVRRGGRVASLRQLEGTFARLGPAEARLAYAHALAATEQLAAAHGLHAVRRLLERLGEGRPFEDAFRETFYTSYDEFDRAWAAALR
ncbi:MAG TPA: peptidase MA family metallohydrolase, partial [Thermodesulfobacteriota bacterium]|nr:peptidase MA family metallohydrolase [Thermodesulfobacteriota bacterium]